MLPHLSTIPPLGQPFTVLPVVDSTNNYAMAQVQAGKAGHGSVFMALEQTSGKGQRGKQWHTASGENIAMSIVVDPYPLNITQQQLLSFAVALACYDLFKKYAGEENTRIKWPNDLYWQDRKAGGILIESVISSREYGASSWEWAIIGIGININQTSFPPDLPNPVSLKQITGKNFDPVLLAKELHNIFLQHFDELTTRGFSAIYKHYLANLYKKNERVRLRKDNRAFEATIMGVSESGRLIAEHGIIEEFDFGAVDWMLK